VRRKSVAFLGLGYASEHTLTNQSSAGLSRFDIEQWLRHLEFKLIEQWLRFVKQWLRLVEHDFGLQPLVCFHQLLEHADCGQRGH
jgi:hypothetical protein